MLGALALSPQASSGQVPAGYYLSDGVPLPDSITESYFDGVVRLSVQRSVADDRNRRLIEIAERLFPEAATIERDAAANLRRVQNRGRWPDHFREAAERAGPRWWWHRWDRVWLPYALTSPGISHYIDAIRDAAERARSQPLDSIPAVHFEYTARVEPDGLRPVVLLYAKWSYSCGSRCGLWFTHERRVHFDSDGAVVRVEGDGPTLFIVS